MAEYLSKKPNDYLILSIITTLLCNTILGIVAIVKSFQVNTKWDNGDHAGAYESSISAKKWAIASIIVAAITYTIFIIEAFALLFFEFKLFDAKFEFVETIISLIKEMIEGI